MRGKSAGETAANLMRTHKWVYNWLERYDAGGLMASGFFPKTGGCETNNGSPSEELLTEIRSVYARSEEFLDQTEEQKRLLEQRHQAQMAIEDATPKQLDRILEAMNLAGKIGQVVVN